MIAEYTIRLNVSQANSGLNQLESRMNSFESSLNRTQGSLGSFGSTLGSAFAGGAIASGLMNVIGKMKELAVESFNTAREFTNMSDAIKFASGSDSAKNIEYLDSTIDRLGLDIKSTYTGFKTFEGALMGTALAGDKGREIFTAVSEAATVMKLSGEQAEGAFLALGQMISKGNVSAEELRGQLGERLPGAFQIFARSLGVSTQKLDDMLKKGEVLAVDALPKFAAELRNQFGPGVLAAQENFNANWNRLNNFLYRAKVELGQGIMGSLNEIVSIIPKLDFSPLMTTLRGLTDQVSILSNQFSQLFNMFGVSLTTFEKLTIGIRYISYIFQVAWTPIRVFTQAYSQLVNLVTNSIPIFTGLAKILAGAFKFNFSMILEGVNQMKDGLKSLTKGASESASAFIHNEKKGWSAIFAPINDPTKKGSSFSMLGSGSPGGTGGMGKSPASTGKEAGVEKVQSSTRNVTINIQNLIKDVTFQKFDGGSEAKIMDMIKRTLLTAVNDANIQPQ